MVLQVFSCAGLRVPAVAPWVFALGVIARSIPRSVPQIVTQVGDVDFGILFLVFSSRLAWNLDCYSVHNANGRPGFHSPPMLQRAKGWRLCRTDPAQHGSS